MAEPIDPLLAVGDVVLIAGRAWVVASATAQAGQKPYWWQLYLVPEGKEPLDLGKTWTRSSPDTEGLSLTRQTAPPTTTDLEPKPPTGPVVTNLENGL